jgi:hypothetical protein
MESVSFQQIGIWVACGLLILNAYIQWRTHQREEEAAKEPNPPLHKEYVIRSEFEAHVDSIEKRFTDLQEDRRRNVTVLHSKIDGMRGEVKQDMHGVHQRTDALLAAFSELKGEVKTFLKNSTPPFTR